MLELALCKKNNEDQTFMGLKTEMWTLRCEVGVETVGRQEGMEEKYFLKGNHASACLEGGFCLPFQANKKLDNDGVIRAHLLLPLFLLRH